MFFVVIRDTDDGTETVVDGVMRRSVLWFAMPLCLILVSSSPATCPGTSRSIPDPTAPFENRSLA